MRNKRRKIAFEMKKKRLFDYYVATYPYTGPKVKTGKLMPEPIVLNL
jgi:hypothetical protein